MAYCYHVEEPGLRWGGYVDEYVTFDMLPFDIYKSLRRNLKGEPVDVKAASNGKQPLDEGRLSEYQRSVRANLVRDNPQS